MHAQTLGEAVNKIVNRDPRTIALEVVNRFSTACAQDVHRVIQTRMDLALVHGWYKHGQQAAMAAVNCQTMALAPHLLGPLGQVCQLAIALGVLSRPLAPYGIPEPGMTLARLVKTEPEGATMTVTVVSAG